MPELEIRYLRLADILLWEDNTKLHDLDALAKSIERYGFRDALIFDETLDRLVSGHGRINALKFLKSQGKKLPQGITQDKDGEWLVPVQFGISADTPEEARAFAIDHNNIVAAGMNYQDVARMYSTDYARIVSKVLEKVNVISITQEQAQELQRYLSPAPIVANPTALVNQGRSTMAVPIKFYVLKGYKDKAKEALAKIISPAKAKIE